MLKAAIVFSPCHLLHMFNPSDENATSSRNSDKTGTVNKFFFGGGEGDGK